MLRDKREKNRLYDDIASIEFQYGLLEHLLFLLRSQKENIVDHPLLVFCGARPGSCKRFDRVPLWLDDC